MLSEIAWVIRFGTFSANLRPKWLGYIVDLSLWLSLIYVVVWNTKDLFSGSDDGFFRKNLHVFVTVVLALRIVVMEVLVRKYIGELNGLFSSDSPKLNKNPLFRLVFYTSHLLFIIHISCCLNYQRFHSNASAFIMNYFAVMHFLFALTFLDVLKEDSHNTKMFFESQYQACKGGDSFQIWSTGEWEMPLLKRVVLFNKLFGMQIVAYLLTLVSLLTVTYSRKLIENETSLGTSSVLYGILLLWLIQRCQAITNNINQILALLYQINEILHEEGASRATGNLRQKLLVLGFLLETSQPYFTVTGLFEINYDMALMVFSASVSCFLVVFK